MDIKKTLWWLVAALTLGRLFTAASFELALDEGYYWVWAQHPSLSYYDHPPMVAWLIALTTLLGDSELAVRLGAALGSAAASLLIYRLGTELFNDPKAALWAVVLANCSLIFSAGALIVSPDTPLIPFHLAAMLLFWRATRADDQNAWGRWVAAGSAIGLAMLSKYTAVFFFPGALLFLLASAERRRWLFRPHPYVSALIAALFFSPVIFWNAAHNWASFAFQGRHGLERAEEIGLSRFLEFAGFQAALYSVGIFVLLMAAFIAAGRASFGGNDGKGDREPRLYLFCMALPTLVFFTLNSLRATVEGNWPVLGFMPLLVLAGPLAAQWDGGGGKRLFLRASAVIGAAFVLFLHIQLIEPVIPHPQRYEISRRVFGWKILAGALDAQRGALDPAFVIADRFQTATLMTFYTRPHLEGYMFGPGNALRFPFLPQPDAHKGRNALYLTELSRDESPRLAPLFDKMERLPDIEITRRGELVRRFALYRCYNYRGGLNGL